MSLFARLFNGGHAEPPAPEEAAAATLPATGRAPVPQPAADADGGNPDLAEAIARLDNPRASSRLDTARAKIMDAFDDGERQRRMVAAVRRLLHEGNPPRGDSGG